MALPKFCEKCEKRLPECVCENGQVDTLVGLLYKTARKLWSTTLRTHDEELFNEMKNVKKGNLAIEITNPNFTNNSIGYLEESFEESGKYIIKRLSDGKIINWSNSQFIRIPIAI